MQITPTLLCLSALVSGCALSSYKMREMSQGPVPPVPKDAKSIIVAGGCFWCIEALFEDLKGVYYVESAYVGGSKPNVTYAEVCSGLTGHAEAVKIVFDPKAVSSEDLLRLFFVAHDPTTLNRQAPDVGTQYRSAIFYANDEEKRTAEKIKDEIEKAGIWPRPIVTTIEPVKNYTVAEDYHQDYFRKFENASESERAQMNAGYCRAIIEPKVREFRKKFADKLKKGG